MKSRGHLLSSDRPFPAAGSVALCLVFAGLASLNASAANLVNNGDFANVGNVFVANVASFGGDDLLTGGGTNIPGWTNVTPAGAPAKYANEMWIEPNNNFGLTASPHNGSGYFVDLTGEGNEKPYGGLEQKITTVAGAGYTLTFALGAATQYNGSGTAEAAITASATGSAQLASKLFTLAPSSANQWETETLTFIADSDSTTITFLADSSYTSRYVGLDDVTMTSRLLSTTVSLTASTTSATSGTAISLTSLVKPSEGAVTPIGTVTFKSGTQTLGSATLNGTGQATLTTSALAVGKDSVTAVYSGDTIHATATSAAVSVTITGGAAVVDLSATSLAFGDQATGTTSAAKTVTLTNGGTGTVTLTSIALSAGETDDFTLSKTCGTSLAAKASCTVSIAFKPVSAGNKSATLSITDNATGSPQKVALTGTGTSGSPSATVTVSATTLTFHNQAAGTASSAQTVTVTNGGTAAVTLTSIAVTGGESDDFLSTTTCGASLAAKASCTVSVTFKPVSPGAKSASLSIADNASGSPQKVALSGTGV
jgi:hypothetical protein